MDQYGVFRLQHGEIVVILQSDMFREFKTRVVAPLVPRSRGKLATALNPVLRHARRDWVLATHLLNVVSVTAFRERLGSLASEEYTIKNAVDRLLLGV
ncbi:MAG TPA: CcdB family protein [Hyphomicrobiaceae bacterium]|nr:CcdB family protein [Hyphomicrobiaceae bacterium]